MAGKNGGARPGSGRKKAPHTIETEARRKVIVEFVSKNLIELLEIWIGLARSADKDSVRESAVTHLIEQAYGKPKSVVDLGDSEELGVLILPKRMIAGTNDKDDEDE